MGVEVEVEVEVPFSPNRGMGYIGRAGSWGRARTLLCWKAPPSLSADGGAFCVLATGYRIPKYRLNSQLMKHPTNIVTAVTTGCVAAIAGRLFMGG